MPTQTKKRGFVVRLIQNSAHSFTRWVGKLISWEFHKEHIDWMKEGASVLNPKRFPHRSKWWSAAPLNKRTFSGELYCRGMTEQDLHQNYSRVAWSCLVAWLGLSVGLSLLALYIYRGNFGATLAAVGYSTMLAGYIFKSSYRLWQMRVRDYNLNPWYFFKNWFNLIPSPYYYYDDTFALETQANDIIVSERGTA